jgi:hypothetical protein
MEISRSCGDKTGSALIWLRAAVDSLEEMRAAWCYEPVLGEASSAPIVSNELGV